jgi:hypothetical protein
MLGGTGLALNVACTSTTPPPAVPSPPVAVVAPPQEEVQRRPSHVPPRPAHKPAGQMASLPPSDGAPAVEPGETVAPAGPEAVGAPPANTPPVDGNFDRLHGLDAAGTVALLGEPRQRAESPPAVLWRYASRDCELDVYFYLDLQSRVMRVLHYEVRNHDDGAERTQPQCYRELVAERRAESAGSADRPR